MAKNAKSTTTPTPTRNNYALPNTPIASAKRPRNPNNNSYRPQMATIATTPTPSSSTDNTNGYDSMPPPITPSKQSLSTPKKSSLPAVSRGSSASDSNEKEKQEGYDVNNFINTLSPMHPPKPLVGIRCEEDSEVVGLGIDANEDLLKSDELNTSTASSSTWVTKVDALFSPVLQFWNGTSECLSGENVKELEDSHININADDDDDDSPAVTEVAVNVVEVKTPESPLALPSSVIYDDDGDVAMEINDDLDTSLEVDDDCRVEEPTITPPKALPEQPSPPPPQDDEVSISSSTISSSTVNSNHTSDEFNPYLFIKQLPHYSTVAIPHKICLPPKDPSSPRISLILDLDETLVHCTVEPTSNPDLVFPVKFNGIEYKVSVKKRPFLKEFLERVQDKFEVIVFTASQRVYADELLDRIDPEHKYIKHRMFRESCLPVEGNYLKDLNVLGRDLKTSVLVDNSPHAFGYQVDNGIPIESWFDDPNDTELLKLEAFLNTLHGVTDVRKAVRQKFQTWQLIMNA